jgi:protein-L-isoaspartate(D-aspartate) O-methyltransferase
VRSFADQRARMVKRQLRRRGIESRPVLDAMAAVPREAFVPEEVRSRAYDDGALPIDGGQTISQPWIVAAICQALDLDGSETVLEVGTGSGYSAAVLAHLAARVISVERSEALAADARDVLAAAGAEEVEVIVGDGSIGLPERAPFGGIAVHAAVPAPPAALLGQLADCRVLVAPVAAGRGETLTAFRRNGEEFESRAICSCRFVPLIGAGGYPEGSATPRA